MDGRVRPESFKADERPTPAGRYPASARAQTRALLERRELMVLVGRVDGRPKVKPRSLLLREQRAAERFAGAVAVDVVVAKAQHLADAGGLDARRVDQNR